jgi:hypothetical protein
MTRNRSMEECRVSHTSMPETVPRNEGPAGALGAFRVRHNLTRFSSPDLCAHQRDLRGGVSNGDSQPAPECSPGFRRWDNNLIASHPRFEANHIL